MKKNNLLALFVLGIFTSCTNKAPETLLSKWEKKASRESGQQRMLASSNLNEKECFKDIFDVTGLKREVFDLESKFLSSEKVRGTWKHLDLSKLPVPQANFLQTYGKKIGDLKDPESIDYTGCEDVPCIFNRIYNKENHVAGYVHYLWYLKFGHLLSADNLVPNQKSATAGIYQGKEFPLSSYLYDESELFGMWRLSHMLKPPHTNLVKLSEIQRTPRGSPIEDRPANVCGFATSTGYIVLSDECLTIRGGRMDTGYLYQAVTHELTHQVDYQQAEGTKVFYRSVEQDYLDLIGMYVEEYVNDKNKVVKGWKHRPGIRLVTSYAGASPAENFAETISLFRMEGDLVKREISQEQYTFVSKEYFDNKNFESHSLLKNWISTYSLDTEREALRAVIDCSEEKTTTKNSYFSISDFQYKASPQMINCLGSNSESIAQMLSRKAALYEPEGCNVLSRTENKTKWNGLVKDSLKSVMTRYLKELESDKDYIAKIQSFYSDIDDRTIPKEIFVSCYDEVNESECYANELTQRAKNQISGFKITPDQEKELIDLYLSVHPLLEVSHQVKEGYTTFVHSNLDKIREEAQDLWRSCKAISHSDVESPRGFIFQVTYGYMVSSFYNCLNTNAPDAIKRSVRSFEVDGSKLQNTKEELFLSREVQPQLVKMLHEKFDAARARELIEMEQYEKEEDGSIRSQILSNFLWAKNVASDESVRKDCQSEARRLILFEPLFHIKNKEFSEFIDTKICMDVTSTPAYKKWITEEVPVLKGKILNELDSLLYSAGEVRARKCLIDFPITNALSKIKFRTQRDSCLTANWSEIEDHVLKDLKSNQLVKKFDFDLEEFRAELSKNARRTQLKLIKEKFN